MGSIPGLGRSPGVGNGNPLQYSCLEVPWTDEPGGHNPSVLRVEHDWALIVFLIIVQSKDWIDHWSWCFYFNKCFPQSRWPLLHSPDFHLWYTCSCPSHQLSSWSVHSSHPACESAHQEGPLWEAVSPKTALRTEPTWSSTICKSDPAIPWWKSCSDVPGFPGQRPELWTRSTCPAPGQATLSSCALLLSEAFTPAVPLAQKVHLPRFSQLPSLVLQIWDSDCSLLPTLGPAVLPHLPPAFSSWNSLQGGQWIHFCAWDHTVPWWDMSPTKSEHCFAGSWMVGLSSSQGTWYPMRQVLPSLCSRFNSQVRERPSHFHNITCRHRVTSELGQRHATFPPTTVEMVQEQDGLGRCTHVDIGQGDSATKVNFQIGPKNWFRTLERGLVEILRTIAYD